MTLNTEEIILYSIYEQLTIGGENYIFMLIKIYVLCTCTHFILRQQSAKQSDSEVKNGAKWKVYRCKL